MARSILLGSSARFSPGAAPPVVPAKGSARLLGKKLVANLVDCPTLGAPSRETQTNPLLDNYEGMAITPGGPGMAITPGGPGLAGVSMISNDNFSPNQFTRVLNLIVRLP